MIELESSAMQAPEALERCLLRVATWVMDGRESGHVRDDNGNKVGSWAIEDET